MVEMGWRVVVALVALAASACLSSQITPCGDQFCPPGKTCHVPSGSCYGSDQLTACDGLPDNSECRIADLVGYCRDGICLGPRCGDGIVHEGTGEQCDDGTQNSNAPNAHCREDCLVARCGDGIVDMGEVCDDGNAEAGDACAPGCGSDETCGNGVIDAGEECDDANTTVRDGCSGCLKEQLVVQPIRTTGPRLRTEGSIAFDAARQRLVVFGGKAQTAGLRGDTWEWDGHRWRELLVLVSPSPRFGAAMVYDPSRKRVVLFGGEDSAGVMQNDVWEFDGARWTDRSPMVRPPGRRSHAMAYDAARDRVVVFGGRGMTDVLADTWEWDGAAQTWFETTAVSTPPPARENVAMAYDPRSNAIVMFGGKLGDATFDRETFLYRGTTGWAKVTLTGTLPPARSNHMAAFDAGRGRVVIALGTAPGYLRDLWEWTGTEWQQSAQSPSGSPVILPGFSIYGLFAYDSARRQLVFVYASNTYARNPTSGVFAGVPASGFPPARMQAGGAYDPVRGKMVVYGGEGPTGFPPNDVWEWDGSRWSMIAAPASPPAGTHPLVRKNNAMTYSPTHGVMMSGSDPDHAALGDLWSWNGTAWARLSADEPLLNARNAHGMIYDRARDRLVVYGGNTLALDTLEWNGAWTLAMPMSPIGFRHNFAMEYDPIRQRTLLVGGGGYAQNFLTYEYDGTTWTPVASPSVYGKGSRLVFDPVRKALVWMVDPENVGLEIWEWNGTQWNKRRPEPTPGPLYRPAAAYHAVRGEIVMFGGRSNGTITNSMTTVAYQPNAASEACTFATLDYDNDGLAGCADPDCAARCTPLCVGLPSCPADSPTCGDGTCDPLEDCALCPADCMTGCPVSDCGDFRCDGGEDATSCPGDC